MSFSYKSIRTSLFFVMMLALMGFFELKARAEPVLLQADDARWIATMIFQNECSLRTECLTTWNEGEDFPSLGIGHFIWYPEGRRGPFRESFPEFLAYLKSSGHEVPEWLDEMSRNGMPWKNREEFLAAQSEESLIGMRQFLQATMAEQALFMIRRLQLALPKMIAATPADKRALFAEKVFGLTRTRNGLYAMIDYLNFKGEGLLPQERYREHGWGLFQVFYEMAWPVDAEGPVAEFVEAARIVLRRRVDNAPSERREERWIQGWENRVKTYSASTDVFDLASKSAHQAMKYSEKTEAIELVNRADFSLKS